MNNRSKKIIVGITAPLSIVLLENQLKYFVDQGYDMYLMAPFSPEVVEFCTKEKCIFLSVDIVRDISVIDDIKALLQIINHYKKIKPDIVNVGTPKMGFLGIIGASLMGVRKRIYTCRGFRYEHENGFKMKILILMEKITSRFAHKIICISQSVKEKGIQDKIFKETKTIIFGNGSSNGIDLTRFNRNAVDPKKITLLKQQLLIENKFVFGFVGRIIDRKGINELFVAFSKLYKIYPEIFLIIVGKANSEQLSDKSLLEKLSGHPGIHLAGFQSDIPLFMSLFDVFVLPAWWEGFGNTLIQAAAMGIPVISTRVTGCMDAVNDGYNGLLIEGKSVSALVGKMELLFKDVNLREQYGKNGIEWAKKFESRIIWEGLRGLYDE